MPMVSCFHALRSRQRGMALVITLAIVVLLTVAILAFFSHATANRQVEASRVNRTKADVLAKSASDYVVSSFLQEIGATTNSSATNYSGAMVYLPKAVDNLLPRRGTQSAIAANNTVFANLIRQSTSSADGNSSSHNSATPTRNGRTVTPARWNLPRLLSGDGFTSVSQLPDWIYIDRNGGVTATPSQNVIGRFAYNVYEIGGLLNANAAGYPSSLNTAQVASLKSSQAGADLTRFTGVAQSAVDDLVSFRNPEALTATDYLKNVTAAAKAGFLTTSVTEDGVTFNNNFFTSRQDLLKYVRTQNPALAGALPYLTHFSRSLSAPLWEPPSTPANTNPNITATRFTSTRTLTGYHDDGSTYQRDVQAGDPLIGRRFSLARLSWLAQKENNPSSTTLDAAISACFGLQWDAANERWNYIAGNTAGEILPLAGSDSVASRNREPNFFELLKAGILDGSLGTAATAKTMAATANQTLEANKTLQLLRIGASIIDCADNDNFPTIITAPVSGTSVEVAGVEDLPYFYAMGIWTLYDRSGDNLLHLDIVSTPLLINPHRASGSSVSSANTPASISVNISSGTLEQVKISSGELAVNPNKNLATLPAISLGRGDFESYRSGPRPIRSSSATNRLGAYVPFAAAADSDALVFCLFSYENEAAAHGLPPPYVYPYDQDKKHNPRLTIKDLVFRLQYTTRNGTLKTYSTLAGNEALPGTGIYGTGTTDVGTFIQNGNASLSSSRIWPLWDPRTNRLGPSMAYSRVSLNTLPETSGTNGAKGNFPITFSGTSLLGLWPQGGKSQNAAGDLTNVADPDGAFRPADGWLGNAANPYRQTSGSNLITTAASRPVVLNRPYQSVGELGYVFRDTPWKTISFFDETSADGALLGLFCVAEEPEITAARLNLNTRQPLVLEALLSGSSLSDNGSTLISSAQARDIAQTFVDYSFDADGSPSDDLLRTPAYLPDFMSSSELSGLSGLSVIKYEREAIVRAIANATQTRTWNLLIDVVTQAGRFPSSSGTSAEDFVVEGEKRFWVSIAIDRYTGRIIERQVENVDE